MSGGRFPKVLPPGIAGKVADAQLITDAQSPEAIAAARERIHDGRRAAEAYCTQRRHARLDARREVHCTSAECFSVYLFAPTDDPCPEDVDALLRAAGCLACGAEVEVWPCS